MHRPWFLACLTVACSSGSPEPAPEPVSCEAPGYATDPEPAAVGSVEATLRDLDGNAPAEVLVQVCGLDLCINGETDVDGYAAVAVGAAMKLPAFKYGNGVSHTKIALPLVPPIDEALDLGELYLPALPAEGTPISAGATSSSAGAELTVPADASVEFHRLVYRTADEQAFRAAELPADLAPAELDAGMGFEIFFALGPLDTEFCPPAELALPNSAGFEAGAEVEFWLHGLDIEERHAPYGGFAKVADGAVSEDGSMVRTKSGGLPLLALVAVKLKD